MGKVSNERQAELDKLRDATDNVLEEICDWPKGDRQVMGAINWEDRKSVV